MKRKLPVFILVITLVLSIAPSTALAAGLSNFKALRAYTQGQFKDVPANEWYADTVKLGYEYGLIDGTSATTYSPTKELTIAEAIKLAA